MVRLLPMERRGGARVRLDASAERIGGEAGAVSPGSPTRPAGEQLHARGNASDMLPVIIDDRDRAIANGTSIEGGWLEASYSDGGVDWKWGDVTVLSDEARCLLSLRSMFVGLIDLLDRIDDLVAAQRDIGEQPH